MRRRLGRLGGSEAGPPGCGAFHAAYAVYGRDRRGLLAAAGLAVAEHGVQMLLVLAIARSLDVAAGPAALLGAAALFLLVLRLPLAPDGWGVGELSAVGLLGLAGVGAATAFSVSLVNHVVLMLALAPGDAAAGRAVAPAGATRAAVGRLAAPPGGAPPEPAAGRGREAGFVVRPTDAVRSAEGGAAVPRSGTSGCAKDRPRTRPRPAGSVGTAGDGPRASNPVSRGSRVLADAAAACHRHPAGRALPDYPRARRRPRGHPPGEETMTPTWPAGAG